MAIGAKTILLAEDNPDDALIFRMMFRKASLPHQLHQVEDGQQAIDWLEGKGDYNDRAKYPVPDLLILDLKMPMKTGFEVLEWVRKDSRYGAAPTVILSSSDDPKDLKRAQELGAVRYFIKSPQLREVMEFLQKS